MRIIIGTRNINHYNRYNFPKYFPIYYRFLNSPYRKKPALTCLSVNLLCFISRNLLSVANTLIIFNTIYSQAMTNSLHGSVCHKAKHNITFNLVFEFLLRSDVLPKTLKKIIALKSDFLKSVILKFSKAHSSFTKICIISHSTPPYLLICVNKPNPLTV